MASPHPPLTGVWFDAALALSEFGPMPRPYFRYRTKLSNRACKVHTRLMKLRNLIDIRDGIITLTPHGLERLEQSR